MMDCVNAWMRALMKLIADANILFSCLIKDGATRHLWLNPVLKLYSPKFIVDELNLHASEICGKAVGSPQDVLLLTKKLLGIVTIVQDDDLEMYLPAAKTLSEDKKDWVYLACALKENAGLWSNDKGFNKQNRVPVFTTSQLIKEIGTL